jgi:hypothetical protein
VNANAHRRILRGAVFLGAVAAFVLLCFTCLYFYRRSNDFYKLASSVKTFGTAEQWHGWAAQVLERSKTNSSSVPSSEWPAFVRRTARAIPTRAWEVAVQTHEANQQPYVSLFSIGGVQSISVDIGSVSFVETDRQGEDHVTMVYPGVYVSTSL